MFTNGIMEKLFPYDLYIMSLRGGIATTACVKLGCNFFFVDNSGMRVLLLLELLICWHNGSVAHTHVKSPCMMCTQRYVIVWSMRWVKITRN